MGLTKKEILDLFLRKSEKSLWKWNMKLSSISKWRKIVFKNIWDCHCIGYNGTINSNTLRDINRNVFNI